MAAFLLELRLPIAMIAGFGELLRETPLQPFQLTALTAMQENAQHLCDLVADYHDLLHLGGGSYRPAPRRLETMPFLHGLLQRAAARAGQRGIGLDTAWGGFLPAVVQCDADAVQRAVLALLSQALLHCRRGQLRLSVTCHQYRLRPAPLSLCFDLRSGSAAADGSPPRMFAVGGQLGLGPLLARELADRLGGALHLGRDAAGDLVQQISFALTHEPGAGWDDPRQATAPGPAAVPRLTARVLLAEAMPGSRLLLASALQRAGAEVAIVERGDLAVQAALAAARGGTGFAALVLDVALPVVDGREVVSVLRGAGYGGRIVCLGGHRDAAQRQCIEAGADACLGKPVSLPLLLGTLASLLS